jgi:hypothetical protein
MIELLQRPVQHIGPAPEGARPDQAENDGQGKKQPGTAQQT